MPINSRNKGCAFERTIVNELRDELFFEDAVTSRAESRNMDAKGVDICGVPFHVQCKAYDSTTPKYMELLDGMPDDQPPVIFHKRNRLGVIVAMKWDYLYELVKVSDDNWVDLRRLDKELKNYPNFHKIFKEKDIDWIQFIRRDTQPMQSIAIIKKEYFYDLIDQYYVD